MKNVYRLPNRVIQAVGLACVPLHEIGSDAPLARRPVAAAVATVTQRDDGHVDVVATRLSDARDLEFPLPHLLDRALMPGSMIIVSAADRATLAADAMARRFFVEPRLARVVDGTDTVEPVASILANPADEAQLCRRLGIPIDSSSDKEVERIWSRHAPEPVEAIALGRAVSRLMLWAHIASFRTASPEPFFETMLPLREWMDGQGEAAPTIYGWATSRPMMRAASFAGTYRDYRRRVAAGDTDAAWVSFEENLLHT
ncbi:hypothetical protein [Sphingomonas olei]|uniref:Uncharacterized protein n=1 Tax=Sphingomonas olei TaxID=1886787 RepID=A0ABY2QGE8_9SPHN|nr:hypothetical protein [Sphingomonas olei]THG37249.1 hypothetical protein E5988_16055 [Sphingomonas olei]